MFFLCKISPYNAINATLKMSNSVELVWHYSNVVMLRVWRVIYTEEGLM